jgi:cyanophycin synthetase
METHGVSVKEIQALRGGNIYAYFPVLHIIMDIGAYEEMPSNSFLGFVERLTTWLPGLQKHECNLGRPGGFIERLNRGTYLAHICEHITLELQGLMGFDVTYGRARGTGEQGVYRVIIAYREEEPARAAFETALRLTLAAMHNEAFDVAQEIERLQEIADDYRLGPSTNAIVRAARRRDIPVTRISPQGSLVQLGYGKYQKRILASETSLTSSIAVDICQDKALTNQMLQAVGIPVPKGQSVRTADEAWELAQELGLPIVVKPDNGNQGKGVSVNLTSESSIREAFALAKEINDSVLVEKHICGRDYRLLVVNGKLVAAACREPAHVIGDGASTIRELVDIVNQDPRRRPGHSGTLSHIELNDAALLVLKGQNLTPESIPDAGQKVRLRTNSNLSTGGTATDVTDDVHPHNAYIAELAAQMLALDVAGIDMLCEDITRPMGEQNGAIVEVNAAPGLRMHIFPTEGQSRDVGKPIVEMLYPDKEPSRIPVIAVTGTNGKTTVTRLIGHIYETAHRLVGMTCTDGTYIGKERILTGDCSGPRSARAILLHPRVEVAVLETARGGILREGLAFDMCSVAVVTNVSPDHLGLKGIDTLEDLARVKQVIVEAVKPGGYAVLNADDRLVSEMAAATEEQVVYFSTSPDNPIIKAHLAENIGWAVYVEDNTIILATGEAKIELVELERLPFTLGGSIGFQVQNALAATAAAWAGGVNPAMIVRGLSTFRSDYSMAPGRFNILESNGVQIILDYAHNAAAIAALMDGIGKMDKRWTAMVVGLPGDRRDEDIRAAAEATIAAGVNHYFLHDLKLDQRGRKTNEIPEMMQAVLREKTDAKIDILPNHEAAILQAWRTMQPGQRLIVLADLVDEAIDVVRNLTESVAEDAECDAPLARVFSTER